MLGWQAEWMAYQIELDGRLSAPALVVPVFDKAVVGSTATVEIPAQSILRMYAGMEFGSYHCAGFVFRACVTSCCAVMSSRIHAGFHETAG